MLTLFESTTADCCFLCFWMHCGEVRKETKAINGCDTDTLKQEADRKAGRQTHTHFNIHTNKIQ